MPTIRDELHLAMGEFLTECSNLENELINLVMFCQPDRDSDDVFREMLNETFGNKLKEFKRVCKVYKFSVAHRATIDAAIVDLDNLLPRRNLIVHGTTFDVSFGNEEPKAYRVGATKGNIEYMHEFLGKAANVETSFSPEQVRHVRLPNAFIQAWSDIRRYIEGTRGRSKWSKAAGEGLEAIAIPSYRHARDLSPPAHHLRRH